MAEDDRSHKLTFLYKMIDDNQQTIRYLDTKAGFGIAILGAILGKVLLDQDQLYAIRSHTPFIIGLFILLGVFILASAALGFKTVFPTVNPAENVSFPDDLGPKFFISELNCPRYLRHFFSSKKFATLKVTHAEYCRDLRDASPERLESILAAEVLKLSFIRQIKTDRLAEFAKFLTVTVALFTILMLVAHKESPQLIQSRCECSKATNWQGPRDIYNFGPAQPTNSPPQQHHAEKPANSKTQEK